MTPNGTTPPGSPQHIAQEMGKLWQEYTLQMLQSPQQWQGMSQLMELWGNLAAPYLQMYGAPHGTATPFTPPVSTPAAAASAAGAQSLAAILHKLEQIEHRLATLEQRAAAGTSTGTGAG